MLDSNGKTLSSLYEKMLSFNSKVFHAEVYDWPNVNLGCFSTWEWRTGKKVQQLNSSIIAPSLQGSGQEHRSKGYSGEDANRRPDHWCCKDRSATEAGAHAGINTFVAKVISMQTFRRSRVPTKVIPVCCMNWSRISFKETGLARGYVFPPYTAHCTCSVPISRNHNVSQAWPSLTIQCDNKWDQKHIRYLLLFMRVVTEYQVQSYTGKYHFTSFFFLLVSPR